VSLALDPAILVELPAKNADYYQNEDPEPYPRMGDKKCEHISPSSQECIVSTLVPQRLYTFGNSL
jgi:hypothetical protein